MRPSHFEKVANELSDLELRGSCQAGVDLKLNLPDEEQLFVPVSKLLDYSLNPEHAEGKHKARLFSELLGITGDHWRYLAYQLYDGLRSVPLERTRITQHGVQYGARIQCVGLNGQVYTVETAWIIRQARPAQLVTAYPAEKQRQVSGLATPPPWVPDDARGSRRWQTIYDAASRTAAQAAAACIPEPSNVHGYGVELEGLAGGARVRLNGRRSAFARWLIAKGHAHTGYGPGVYVNAIVNSQSADRAEAYAKAFSRVLWLNGIDGVSVETYLS